MFCSTLFWINCAVLSFPLPSASSEHTCSATVSSSIVNTLRPALTLKEIHQK